MSNIHFPKDPFEKIKVEKIEEDREKEKNKDQKFTAYVVLLLFLKKLINQILKITKSPQEKFKIKRKEIALLFERNIKENLSEEKAFINELCSKWIDFIDLYKKLPQKSPNIELLLQEINSDSLGHYLTEPGGYKWLPLPLVSMLKNLHDNPKKLEYWISLIVGK